MLQLFNLDLLQTAKDEYDASKKDDDKQTFSTGSIFQGLRADLDGYVFVEYSLSCDQRLVVPAKLEFLL